MADVFEDNNQVTAARNITLGPSFTIKQGSLGRVLSRVGSGWGGTTYTVEFVPTGVPSTTVTVSGIGSKDLKPLPKSAG